MRTQFFPYMALLYIRGTAAHTPLFDSRTPAPSHSPCQNAIFFSFPSCFISGCNPLGYDRPLFWLQIFPPIHYMREEEFILGKVVVVCGF